MIISPNCKDCPIGDHPCVPGLGTRTEGTKLFAVKDEATQFDLIGVAMAPAYEEMQREMPMVGPSGQFFRKVVNQLDILVYYLTNCLLCPIPASATDAEVRKAQECCQERLYSEIKSHRPKLILAMGDMPFHQLCNNDLPITEHQGRLFLTHLNVPLVPVAHPAYYLRNPDNAYDFIECVRVGVRYLSNNYHQLGDVTREVVTLENVDRVLEELREYDVLTVDAETSGFHALGLEPDQVLEVGISGNSKHCYIVPVTDTRQYTYSNKVLMPYPDIISRFKELLETRKIINWNGFFDWRFLRALGINFNNWFDGMLAHYCLDERSGSHGLKKVARVYGGAADWESNIRQYLKNPKNDSYALIPSEERWDYLAKDVCYTHEMKELLEREVKDNWPFWNILMPATRVFSETMFRGVLIDPYKVVSVHTALREDLQKDERELWDMAGRVFNPASPKDKAELLYDGLGIPPDPKYGRSTNKKVLDRWRDQYELVDRLISHNEMRHDLSQYIEGFVRRIDKEFRVHPTIKMFGTVTGRISSTDPSIMNIKGDSRVKEIFIASSGKLLAEFDLKGAELRWYCLYAKDEILRDILINGFQGDLGFPLTDEQRRDPHFMIGALAYGPERADELRAPAKMTVFGRLYLRGIASIERQYGKETGQRLIQVMDRLIPNHKKYTEECKAQVRSQGYVESFFGRRRRFPLVTRENENEYQRMAVNMRTQSASSDLNLLNLIYLYEHREELNAWPMFTVHDSIMVEIPDESVIPSIKAALEENANKIAGDYVPFVYDVKYGPNWGQAKKWKGD